MDLTQQTPAQIDAALAEVNLRVQRAESRRDIAMSDIERYRFFGTNSGEPYEWGKARFAQYEQDLAVAEADIETLRAEAEPYNVEYWRRGGWSRFYLVTSSDGHIHSSTGCSTTSRFTQWVWLPDVSGLTEAEAVAQHGERLCSVCFPSAPVEWRDTFFTKRDEAAKAERAAAKAAREAAQITVQWTEFGKTREHVFKTELGAERAAQADIKSWHWYGDSHPSAAEWLANAQTVAEVLGQRRGVDPKELIDTWNSKAAKSVAKEKKQYGL